MTQSNFLPVAGKRVLIREMLNTDISPDLPGTTVTQSSWYQGKLLCSVSMAAGLTVTLSSFLCVCSRPTWTCPERHGTM